MEVKILNQAFNYVDTLETEIESIIWNEKFRGVGDFEIYTPFTARAFSVLKEDYYIQIPVSDRTMFIDTVSLKTNPETGSKLLVKGLGIESIVDRRIFLRQIIIDANLNAAFLQILTKEFINGIFPERNISNFIYENTTDPYILGQNLKTQFYTENVLDVVKEICEQADIGFRVKLNTANQFAFQLYSGVDRSHGQLTNPFVVFSPEFDNLLNSEYYHSKRGKKNYIFVAGEEGLDSWNRGYYGRWGQSFSEYLGPSEGFKRREMFLDAGNLPKDDENGVPLSDSDYSAQLAQRGLAELYNHQEVEYFDGQVDVSRTYKYNVDFGLGDYVQFTNEFGLSGKAQILEMTFSENLNGSLVFPTLRNV